MSRLTNKQKHILQQKLCDMKNRCYNPKNKFYKDYGRRGIGVCEEWRDEKNGHSNFQKWALDSGWKEFLSIDRIDVNGNYEPSNCRWSTPKEQANNRRNNAYITIHGVTKTAQEWAEQVGITERAFMSRVNYGWDEDRLLEPKNKPLKMTKAEMTKEIKYWRNLEEQGLLLKLPYNITNHGIVYFVDEKDLEIYQLRSDKIEISKMMISNEFYYTIDSFDFSYEDFGKTVFLTKEEAEQELKRLEGK